MKDNENNNKRGIIYVRVSSEEQVAGTSLDYQEQECRKYCENHGVKVVKIFREEGASAKSAERKQFLRAIDYCREQKKRKGIGYFVVHKCDRFARNVEDHYSVRRKLLDYGTQLHSVTEPIDDSPQGKVFEAMLSAFAEFDNSIRRQRSMDGMSSRINDGIYPWKPPLGYLTQYVKKRGKKKEHPDEPHPDIFPILQRGLRKFATGKYDYIHQFKADLEAWGLGEIREKEVTNQLVHKILNQYLPFYAGFIHNPFTDKTVRGKHQTMISESEYKQIKFYLNRHKKYPEKRMLFREEFPLRQFVSCGECGEKYTGSWSQGSTKKYAYYHCRTKGCEAYGKSIPVALLEQEFEDLLKKITPSRAFWKAFKRDVLRKWETEKQEVERALELRKKEAKDLKTQMEKLSDGYLKNHFTEDFYLKKKEELENRIMANKIEYSECNIERLDLSTLLKLAERYSNSILTIWRELLRPDQRKTFYNFVFKSPVLYHRKDKSWNYSLNEIFCIYKAYLQKMELGNSKSPEVTFRRLRTNQIVDNLRVLKRQGEETLSLLLTKS